MGVDQIPLDERILKQLADPLKSKCDDFSEEYARKCIEANKHNHITATYHLLMKKSLKSGKITISEAFEAKNDLQSLMRRQPWYRNF